MGYACCLALAVGPIGRYIAIGWWYGIGQNRATQRILLNKYSPTHLFAGFLRYFLLLITTQATPPLSPSFRHTVLPDHLLSATQKAHRAHPYKTGAWLAPALS